MNCTVHPSDIPMISQWSLSFLGWIRPPRSGSSGSSSQSGPRWYNTNIWYTMRIYDMCDIWYVIYIYIYIWYYYVLYPSLPFKVMYDPLGEDTNICCWKHIYIYIYTYHLFGDVLCGGEPRRSPKAKDMGVCQNLLLSMWVGSSP